MNRTATLRIRLATLEELNALVAVEQTCFKGVYANHRWNRDQFRYYLKLANGLVLVAERGGHVIAYAAGILSTGRLKHRARLHSVAVMPDFRGEGVGARLLDRFLTDVVNHGREVVSLEVSTSHPDAMRMFERAGFIDVGTLLDYYGPHKNALRMEKSLGHGS